MCELSACSHECHPTPRGPVCACPPGLHLQRDGYSCAPNHVCSEWGVCSQVWNTLNLPGTLYINNQKSTSHHTARRYATSRVRTLQFRFIHQTATFVHHSPTLVHLMSRSYTTLPRSYTTLPRSYTTLHVCTPYFNSWRMFGCWQGCQPQKNRYKCTCDEGYRLADDGFTCKSTGKYPMELNVANWMFINETFEQMA